MGESPHLSSVLPIRGRKLSESIIFVPLASLQILQSCPKVGRVEGLVLLYFIPLQGRRAAAGPGS